MRSETAIDPTDEERMSFYARQYCCLICNVYDTEIEPGKTWECPQCKTRYQGGYDEKEGSYFMNILSDIDVDKEMEFWRFHGNIHTISMELVVCIGCGIPTQVLAHDGTPLSFTCSSCGYLNDPEDYGQRKSRGRYA